MKDLKEFTTEEVQQVGVRRSAAGRWLTTPGTHLQHNKDGDLVRDHCRRTVYQLSHAAPPSHRSGLS